MALDVIDLREFYVSPLGRFVRGRLRKLLTGLWPSVRGQTVLAVGFATPFLRPWHEAGASVMAMMSPAQGAVFWPREGPNVACLADLATLPLADCSVDRILLAHALELAADPEAVLEEVWRVLKPNGRLIVLAPNRRGFWSFSEATPFGCGRPFSSGQLRALLRNQDFVLEYTAKAFILPPVSSGLWLWLAAWLEAVLPACFAAFGGVLVVEASKQVYTPAMVKARGAGRRVLLPLSVPTAPLPTNRAIP